MSARVWSTYKSLSNTVEVQVAALFRRSDGSVIPGRSTYRVVVTDDDVRWHGAAMTRKAAFAIARRHVEEGK